MLKAFFPAALFLLFFCSLSLMALTEYSGDENGDGTADHWYSFNGELLRCVKTDRNYDGMIDCIVTYDERGLKACEQYDFNYDGLMDDFYYYESGILLRREVDSNYDQKIDIWVFLDEGLYIRRLEQDKNFDGMPDYIKDYL
jgi:hypothetical protein